MRKKHADAIRAHRLRHQIIATKVANRLVNRLGPSLPLDMTEEEGVGLPQVDRRLPGRRAAARPRKACGQKIEQAKVPETRASRCSRSPRKTIRAHIGDVIRAAAGETNVKQVVRVARPGPRQGRGQGDRADPGRGARRSSGARARTDELGAGKEIVDRLVRLYELDGVFGIAALGARKELDELAVTRAYTRLGEVLGLDWAQQQVARYHAGRQLGAAAGRRPDARFRAAADRFPEPRAAAKSPTRASSGGSSAIPSASPSSARWSTGRAGGHGRAPMLAQIASQARILLSR